jgi:competence protein ComEC
MTSRSLGHRAPLLWLVIPLMAGLAAGNAGEIAPTGLLLGGASATAGLALWASWRGLRWFAPAVVAAMFLAGAASYALHRPRIAAWDRLPPREARLALRIDRMLPQPGETRAVGLATIARAEEHLQALVGSAFIFRSRC